VTFSRVEKIMSWTNGFLHR